MSNLGPASSSFQNLTPVSTTLDANGLYSSAYAQGGQRMALSYIAAQSAVPVIIAPSSSIAANGIITVGTALPTTYANAWVYLPAGAAYTSSPAGVYFAQFTSTTSGTVYTNYASPATTAFTPNIPTVLGTPVVGVGAFTQTTASNIALANVTITGGSMGLNGAIRNGSLSSNNNSAGAKNIGFSFGTYTQTISTTTNVSLLTPSWKIQNRGALNSNVGQSFNLGGLSSATPIYGAVDTSQNQSFNHIAQIAVATDYAILEAFTIEVLPA